MNNMIHGYKNMGDYRLIHSQSRCFKSEHGKIDGNLSYLIELIGHFTSFQD